MSKTRTYDERYAAEEYYWGKKPSPMCDRVIGIIRPSKDFRPKLIDLGCGEGRNAVFFAKQGYDVVGLDVSEVGLEKTRKYAREEGVHVKTIKADITRFQLAEAYDVIFSTGTLHYLPKKTRSNHFQNYKSCTSYTGIDAFSVFVRKPFIQRAPDTAGKEYSFRSGELMGYYSDWEILYCMEEVFDCVSSGVPHKHCVNRIIARRHPKKSKRG
jgi:tellurite methyltransferase